MWDGLGPAAKYAVLTAYIVATGPIYYTLFHSSPWQATFGKRILKIYVTAEDGQRIGLRRSFARWFAFWALGLSGISLFSLLTIAENQQHKAIHDFLVGTLVWRGVTVQAHGAILLDKWRRVV